MVEATRTFQGHDPQKPIITVTGITGYVGSHVGLTLLKDGTFNVRGAVRDPNNAKKLDPLRKAYGELFSRVEFV